MTSCGALSRAPKATSTGRPNRSRTRAAAAKVSDCTSDVPRWGTPLIWVPTENTMLAGRLISKRGVRMSVTALSALASTVFGETGCAVMLCSLTGQ